ncbi:MAG: BMP family ABC transporter substrate-binding protein [Actinomycetota bacterium]
MNRWFRCAIIALALSGCSAAGPHQAFVGSKIGFILVGSRSDLGYSQAVWEGAAAVARAFPDNVVLRRENVPETSAVEHVMEEMIHDGARIIFATSYGYLKYAYHEARIHPDVIFLHQGGIEPTPHLSNFGTYWGAVYEPVYLAGIAAGSVTRTNKVGYVVAFPIPATYDNVNAFTLGARSVNPKVTVHVVFTQNWCDPSRQLAAASYLLSLGVDVLTQHQDCTRTVLEAAERAHIFSIGYHYDGSQVAPRSWLVGSVWDWRSLFTSIVRTIVDGMFKGSEYNGDFIGGLQSRDNPFILTELSGLVPNRVKALITKSENRFRAGGSPFSGPVVDRDGVMRIAAGVTPSYRQVLTMNYFVAGVVGAIPKP